MDDSQQVVVVVDDDASVRKSLPRLLRAAGMLVEAFASAEEFLAANFADGSYCLVLDVHLPGMTGLELQKEIRRRGFGIPVVFITGRDNPAAQDCAMQNGAVAFLNKPFSENLLLQAVNRAFDRT